jgi:hypothetical protein
MATHIFPSQIAPSRLAAPVIDALAAVLRAVAPRHDARARYDRLQQLQALSDVDLARRGLTRATLARHVYGDRFND